LTSTARPTPGAPSGRTINHRARWLSLETTLNAPAFAVDGSTDRAYYIVGTRLIAFDTTTPIPPPTPTPTPTPTPIPPVPPVVGEAASEFTPLTPTRILDSRGGVGMPGGRPARIVAGAALTLQVTGRGGVPTTGVDSVVLNMTVTGPSAAGFLTVYPSGIGLPDISNLNFGASQTTANLVTVKLGAGGAVSIANAIGTTDVIADVAGYYASSDGNRGSRFTPVTPSRIVDTRSGVGAPGAKLGSKQSLRVDVAGVGGVPAAGVTAVALNVTAEAPTSGGFLTVYPSNVTMPDVSNLNFGANEVVPNQVIVKVSPDGFISVTNDTGATNVLIDIVGYYHENRVGDTGRFFSIAPFRMIDTRVESPFPGAKLRSGNTLYTGEDTADEEPFLAWALNVTVSATEGSGFVTVYPYPGPVPDASNLNYVQGRDVPNHVIAPTGHQVGFYNYGGRVHLIVDVFGAFLK
jgi:hypothetical protein